MHRSDAYITDIRVVAATADDRRLGLLFWISFNLDAGLLHVDGVCCRRPLVGTDLTISWPSRRSASGRLHPILRVRDDAFRIEIERRLLDEVRQVMLGSSL